MFVRYVKHNHRNAQLEECCFYGPFVDEMQALRWIQGLEPELFLYEDQFGTKHWVENPDEPLEFFTIIEAIPVTDVVGEAAEHGFTV